MAKDGTNRGGARIGSGQKKKALADKILDGNPGNRKLAIMDFTDMTELTGESMPKPRGYVITVYVKENGRQALFTAEDQLSLLKVTLGDRVYYGRITKLSDFDRISREYFKAEITLAKEVDE